MARKRVKLAYIADDSTRKSTFKKRKKGLLKKVSELSILCGIDACAIIYSPYDFETEVWPSPVEAEKVLNAFKELPEIEQNKKKVNQDSFLRQRISKAKEQLKKQKRENREKEITQVMFQGMTGKSLQHLNMVDLNDLGKKIDQYLKEVDKKIEGFNTVMSGNIDSQVSPSIYTSSLMSRPNNNGENELNKGLSDVNIENMQKQQWFMELMSTPQDQLGFGGSNATFPLGDNGYNDLFCNMNFP